jgi:hypothetical protein
MAAGYSKRPLFQKLGIKPGSRVWVCGSPENYRELLGCDPGGVEFVENPAEAVEFLHYFTKRTDELRAVFAKLKSAIRQDGMLWISWPKKAANVETDLTEDIIREIGIAHGLVDIKVCAVDETWSGLKFVYRLKDRK